MRVDLNALFPPTDVVRKRRPPQHDNPVARGEIPGTGMNAATAAAAPTKWAAIYTLELRGCSKLEIAEQLNLSYGSVSQITNDERYIEYREQRLAVLDREFVSMKPLAMDALRKGLVSADENVALRASEQWFKGASFGGFSKQEQPTQQLTAEDVAAALMQAVQVNVNVNVSAPSSNAADDIPLVPSATSSDE